MGRSRRSSPAIRAASSTTSEEMSMAALQTVGTSVLRVDGYEKVTGSRSYSSDVLLPGTLWGKALRSPHPHARILNIDASGARSEPGVHAVLTAADLPV